MLEPHVRKLFQPPNFAHVATLMRDGSPHSAPVWGDVEDNDFVFGKEDQSVAMRNLRRDPRVAVSAFSMEDPYEVAYARGRVKEWRTGEVAVEWFRRIAVRYTGGEYPPPIPTPATVVVVEIERVGYGHFTSLEHTPPGSHIQLPRIAAT